jgi:hypothetical protein
MLIIALLLAHSINATGLPTTSQLKSMHVQKCFDEQNPYGTGIGLSPREDAKDLNTVISVEKAYVVGVHTGLRPMGYLFRIATGAFYYQPQPVSILTTSERVATLALLTAPNVLIHPASAARIRETLSEPAVSIFPIRYAKASLQKVGINVVRCTPGVKQVRAALARSRPQPVR